MAVIHPGLSLPSTLPKNSSELLAIVCKIGAKRSAGESFGPTRVFSRMVLLSSQLEALPNAISIHLHKFRRLWWPYLSKSGGECNLVGLTESQRSNFHASELRE